MNLRIKYELGFTVGTSDKVYIIKMYKDDSGVCALYCSYGRRGSTLKTTFKGTFDSEADAMREYFKIINSKTRKGYKVEAVEDNRDLPSGAISWRRAEAEIPASEESIRPSLPSQKPVEKTEVEPVAVEPMSLVCSDNERAKALERLRST